MGFIYLSIKWVCADGSLLQLDLLKKLLLLEI